MWGGKFPVKKFGLLLFIQKTKKIFLYLDLDFDLDQISIFSKEKSFVNWSEIMKKNAYYLRDFKPKTKILNLKSDIHPIKKVTLQNSKITHIYLS